MSEEIDKQRIEELFRMETMVREGLKLERVSRDGEIAGEQIATSGKNAECNAGLPTGACETIQQ